MVDRSLTLGTLFTANVDQFIRKVDLIKRKVGQLNATMASVGKKTKGFDQAAVAIDKVDTAMTKTGRSTTKFAAQLGIVGVAMQNVLSAAKTTASFMAAGLAIGSLVKGFQAGTKEIIDFDQALKNLQAITKATDAEVIGMGEVIKKVATETKFSTGEVAEGMVLLGQAGFSVQEAMQAMASVANLATGTLADMKLTSDLLTTTIRAFNLSTVESARVADVMANAINRSKLTIDKLRIAFNFVGAASAQAGLSLEETAASMMLLANNGLRASTIGTGLRQVMSRLLAPNRKLREEFKEQGIALERVNPATQGWSNALKNLVPVIVDVETGMVDMAKAYQLFGLRGAQAVAILAKGVASGDYQKMIDYTMEVGSAARMAATQMEGLGVKLKNLADRLKLIAVAIGEAGLTDALKVLVDTLRLLAKVVADFIRSDVGGLVVGFAGWALAIWGVTKSFSILFKTIGLGIRGLKAFGVSMVAVKGATVGAATGFSAFSLRLVKLIGSFARVGLVFGAIITVVRHFVTSIDRQIKSLEKVDAKTQTVVQTLSLYSAKIEDLIEKKAKDQDVTKEHSKLIERFGNDIKELEKDYGNLDVALEDNTDALQDNLNAINELKKTELEKSVKQNIVLIEQYEKQIRRTNTWQALWNFTVQDTIGWLRNLQTAFTLLGERIIDSVGGAFDQLISKLKEVGGVFNTFAESLEYLGTIIGDVWSKIGDKVDEFVSKYAGKSEKVVSLTEAQRHAFVRAARGLDLLGKGTRSIEGIIDELETLSGKKIDTEGIDLINDALKKVSVTIGDLKKKWNETFDDIPSVFKEMYEKMDIIRKVDFHAFLKQLAAKEAAFEKTARIMGTSEAEITAGRAHIRARELKKFEENQKKEVEINREAVDMIIANLDYLAKETEKSYDKRTKNVINAFLAEYDASTMSKEQLIKLEEQFSKEMENITKEREDTLTVLGKDRNKVFIGLEKQTVKEITALNVKMYKDLESQLKGRLRSAKRELASLQKELGSVQQGYREQIRQINQGMMTDEEKWLDDRREAHRLFALARETGETEYFDKAAALAGTLARETKNKQGEIVQTYADSSRTAKNILAAISTEHTAVLEKAVREQKENVKGLDQSLTTIRDRLTELQQNIVKLNSTELALRMEQSLKDMKEMHGVTSKFRTDWESLKSKTITLTVRYKYVGKQQTTTQQSGEESADVQTKKLGGLIKKRLGGVIRKAFADGGKLFGYGGGDVVKALLEPGEYVINKEAVKNIGVKTLDAINSMKSSSQDVSAVVAKRLGGIIKQMAPVPVQRFTAGGTVQMQSARQPSGINVYLQPKFLTGDRRTMRLAAVEIKKALNDLDIRWGKR